TLRMLPPGDLAPIDTLSRAITDSKLRFERDGGIPKVRPWAEDPLAPSLLEDALKLISRWHEVNLTPPLGTPPVRYAYNDIPTHPKEGFVPPPTKFALAASRANISAA